MRVSREEWDQKEKEFEQTQKNIHGERIILEFATLEDKKQIYDMLVSPEVKDFMFSPEHPEPAWEEFSSGEPDNLFRGSPSEEGSYLLIKVGGMVIGSVCYYIHSGRVKVVELDVWISKTQYLGKGYGTEALQLVMSFVVSHYGIRTFIIRPWVKNTNAIKAYKKCGFVEFEVSRLKDFYSDELLTEYGEGDYGSDETVNLICELSQ